MSLTHMMQEISRRLNRKNADEKMRVKIALRSGIAMPVYVASIHATYLECIVVEGTHIHGIALASGATLFIPFEAIELVSPCPS